MLVNMTLLKFRLYGKLYLPPLYNSVEFGSTMFCFIQDFQLVVENLVKHLPTLSINMFAKNRLDLQKTPPHKTSKF